MILYVPQRFIFFLLPFLNVYDCLFVGVVCHPVCTWEFSGCSLVCVCLCYKRDYFESTYLITQQTDRLPSVRDSTSSVCTLYDSLCLFVFLPDLSSAIFSFFSLSLPPSLSFCDYSEELHSTDEQE